MSDHIDTIRPVGKGAFVEAHRVKFKLAPEELVGLKLMISDKRLASNRAGILKRFERQFRLSKSLGDLSAGVFPVVKHFLASEGGYWILMEAFDSDLCDFSSGMKMGWSEALTMLVPILRAIDIMHFFDCDHRDVKPQNMLMNSRKVVLSDFGLAGSWSLMTRYTPSDNVVGTPLYLHPLVYCTNLSRKEKNKKQIRVLRDVYGWYVSWYQLANGGLPMFIGPNPVGYDDVINGSFMNFLIDTSPMEMRDGLNSFFKSDPCDISVTPKNIAEMIIEHFPESMDNMVNYKHLRAILSGDPLN